MAEETVVITREDVRDPSDQEWLISIFGVDGQQPDLEPRPKHGIPKVPTEFHEYKKDKKCFDPQVVSLGPYHHGEDHLEPMEKHKITAAKQFVDEFTCESGGIYRQFNELTGKLKECYDAEVVANRSDVVFARMMFLDGCFVLHFIQNQVPFGEVKTKLEISNDKIPLIIRDMFLIENQLPFEVLDALMNLRWGSSSTGKKNILEFIDFGVLWPMGFWPAGLLMLYSWRGVIHVLMGVIHILMVLLGCHPPLDQPLDQRPFHGSLHLLDILRNILLGFPPSNGAGKQSYKPRYFRSVTELKEIGIRFKKRRMESLKDISYKENLLFPRLLLPTMSINDTTISQLLNLTALEACSDTYSGCGVTSFIHFMNSLIYNDADVKMLRSEGILHHSLGSDDEVARLFNTWPADATNDLKKYGDISTQISWHHDRRVKISIATWWDKYFGSPWTAISFVGAGLLLVVTVIQTYFTAFPRR